MTPFFAIVRHYNFGCGNRASLYDVGVSHSRWHWRGDGRSNEIISRRFRHAWSHKQKVGVFVPYKLLLRYYYFILAEDDKHDDDPGELFLRIFVF